ncbi:MAG TPA: peptide chain release factor-like protein [Methanosarcina sp.]|nr:peptide chain release factor-like protein [Methanosarcina sp.]
MVTVVEKLSFKEVEFNERDFKIEWYSGTGAGGQFRNKHQNSCRLTHIPSGIVSTAQCRSRENSLEEAKSSLLKKLNEILRTELILKLSQEKRILGGSGERGDKIRTYMFQHGKVTDHISGKSCPVDKVMSGRFDLLR